ncbi:MAG: esterase [Pseudomonadota bacterium]
MTDAPSSPGVHIRDIGCFFAGGHIETLTGQPKRQIQVARNGPSRMVDMNGDYVTGQCYVQYVRQVSPAFDAPVMFWHGGAMTGVTWETTPDGRPGWRSYFLSAGFDTYVCDAMERGRAGWSPYPDIYSSAPIFRTQDEAWYMFRIGEQGSYAHDPRERRSFPGSQFPIESFDAFGAQLVPRWTDHGNESLDAYYDALRRVGPVWLIAHSQGGNLALEAVATLPELFKGVVVIEPAAAPPDMGNAQKVPHLFVWGDNMEQLPTWVAYRQVVKDYIEKLSGAGGRVDLLDLPAEGIHGNSHLPMMDRNCEIVAERILAWIKCQ